MKSNIVIKENLTLTNENINGKIKLPFWDK